MSAWSSHCSTCDCQTPRDESGRCIPCAMHEHAQAKRLARPPVSACPECACAVTRAGVCTGCGSQVARWFVAIDEGDDMCSVCGQHPAVRAVLKWHRHYRGTKQTSHETLGSLCAECVADLQLALVEEPRSRRDLYPKPWAELVAEFHASLTPEEREDLNRRAYEILDECEEERAEEEAEEKARTEREAKLARYPELEAENERLRAEVRRLRETLGEVQS